MVIVFDPILKWRWLGDEDAIEVENYKNKTVQMMPVNSSSVHSTQCIPNIPSGFSVNINLPWHWHM